jgi:uncharacterized LabA/DUF88 family protein
MPKVFVFVDGFNLYHSLLKPHLHQYKWLHIKKLIGELYPQFTNPKIFYFTSYSEWSQEKKSRHQLLISALENTGIEVIRGRFGRVKKTCRKCGCRYWTYEEKETDVNISLHLIRYAPEYDIALLLTGDGDQTPSVKEVKRLYPAKKVGLIIPIARRAESLKNICDFHIHITERHLQQSVFPNEITLSSGRKITRPPEWVNVPLRKPSARKKMKRYFHSLFCKLLSKFSDEHTI